MTKPKIFIFPGNGNSHIDTDNWYAWVRDELRKMGYEVFAEDMPDALAARAVVWIPYITKVINEDENVILIGHSSGAVAILRYLETHRVLGAVLVGVNYTDLGFIEEKLAGYYNDPWQWEKIKKNAGWITQYCSRDDPYISEMEARYIHEQLGTKFNEYPGRGHFMIDDNPINNKFPEIIEEIKDRELEELSLEAKNKWENTDAYKESIKRIKNWTKADYKKIEQESRNNMVALSKLMGKSPTDPLVQKQITIHRKHIGKFYTVTDEIYRGLATMYVGDSRFTKHYEDIAPGLAKFLHDAMIASL